MRGWQVFEVFAHYGLAMYTAAVFEHEIVNLLILLEQVPRIKVDQLTTSDFDGLFRSANRADHGSATKAAAAISIRRP